jgi:hypothetical protein
MKMSIAEVYVEGCLTEINMKFESAVRVSGGSHDIHIRRKLSGNTHYDYRITRSTELPWPEAGVVTPPLGQGSFDIILFNTSYVTSGATVVINITITSGCYEPYYPTASIWDYYDLYINDRTTNTTRHIGDLQPAVLPLPTAEHEKYNVPYILVVPVTDWQAPAEGECITDLYPDFADYYATGSPENWYK